MGFTENMRYEYDNILNDKSIVFDVGGYEGKFSNLIYEKYKCNIFIFEPIPGHYSIIKESLLNIEKIKIFNYGLLDKNEELGINIADSASSIYPIRKSKTIVNFKDILEVIANFKLDNIDLIKLNVEGAEFSILNHIIRNEKINIFDNLQIQFHEIDENSKHQYKLISEKLSETHAPTFCYPFLWENWRRK